MLVLLALVAGCGDRDAGKTSAPTDVIAGTVPTSLITAPETTSAPITTTTAAPPTTVAPTTTAAPPTTTFPPVPDGAPARRISRGGNGRPYVALSFDAGSDTGFAAQILDELAADGVKASFGITGKWAEKNPDLFRRIVAEGHHVINHTYDHSSMTGRATSRLPLSRDARVTELRKADDVFVGLTGKSSKPWFRPPYGDLDGDLERLLPTEGYSYELMWSLDSLGWQGLSARQISSRCAGGIFPGAIFLFHVGSQSQDAAALADIIAAIRAAGLQPGSILDVI